MKTVVEVVLTPNLKNSVIVVSAPTGESVVLPLLGSEDNKALERVQLSETEQAQFEFDDAADLILQLRESLSGLEYSKFLELVKLAVESGKITPAIAERFTQWANS